MKVFVIFSLILSVICCQPESGIATMEQTYLALGDSYTIGEALAKSGSFPYQLAEKMNKDGVKLAEPKIIARTGWTTDELITAIKQENLHDKYDLVTLLIGVNNQYRNYSKETYRKEFIELLNMVLKYAGDRINRVYVVSIPDWGVTPFGESTGAGSRISVEIDEFNAINKEETLKKGITYIDITPQSRKAKNDPTLIAGDGLHPSTKMYAKWVSELIPQIKANLQ